MKTIILGDTHGRKFWQYVVNSQKFDRIIFLGDYFDAKEEYFDTNDEINNYLNIMTYVEKSNGKAIALIGNHDYHYFNDINDNGMSGYDPTKAFIVGHALAVHRKRMKMAYAFEDILCTHAGVGTTWLEDQLQKTGEQYKDFKTITNFEVARIVNATWKYKPQAFAFKAYDRSGYGESMGQTPIWIRPASLMKDAQDLKKNFRQIVGHTPVNRIDIRGQATGSRYFFIDALGSSGEYLVYEDGVFTTQKVLGV